MRRRSGKALLLWALTAALCVTACGPAFATAGDRVLVRISGDLEQDINWIETVCRADNGFYMVCRGGETRILRYADFREEPETFVLEGEDDLLTDRAEEEPEEEPAGVEEDEKEEPEFGLFLGGGNDAAEEDDGEQEQILDVSRNISGWFGLNDDLYALVTEEADTENGPRVNRVAVCRAKLEDGKARLEASGLPDLETQYLAGDAEGGQYYIGMEKMLTAGDRLVGLSYAGTARLLIFSLTDGSCMELDPGEFPEIAPGPDGTVLVSRCREESKGMTAGFTLLDPVSGKEKPLTEISGLRTYQMSPCYDPDKEVLYYTDKGQLWKAPLAEPEKAEAVNEYGEFESSALLLPEDYLLLWNQESVMVKSTDPAKLGGVTLHVSDSTGYDVLRDAVYGMNAEHSEVSVVVQEEGRIRGDILKSMLTRDSQTDIYVLPYDAGDFKAMRDRGYLADLSGNREIAEYTERMYPFARNAVKRDGKIIAVPLGIAGDAVNINLRVWKKLGGTEEELPGTWDQFFNWLAELPERLEGTDVKAAAGYATRDIVRAGLIAYMLEMYQIRMEKDGKDYVFRTPLLTGLLQRACEADYEALGIPVNMDGVYSNQDALLDFDGLRGISGGEEQVPLALAFAEGEEAVVPVSMFAAFVNPYIEHPEEAGEFLAQILKKLDPDMCYSLFADRTEPVRAPDAGDPAEWLARAEKLRQLLQTAEGEDRALLEEEIREAERTVEELERSQWRISPEAIGQYQKSQAAFRVMDSYFIRELVGTGGDQEAMDAFRLLFYGDENGEINPEKALEMIDKKLRMQRLEGN